MSRRDNIYETLVSLFLRKGSATINYYFDHNFRVFFLVLILALQGIHNPLLGILALSIFICCYF